MTNLYLYGRNALEEAIKVSTTKKNNLIQEIYITQAAERDGSLIGLLQKNKLIYKRVTVEEIESAVGREAIHQGISALLNERAIYTSLDEVLANSKNTSANPLFILLDELQDPHNVGAIIRSAKAFGATAILMPEHDQVQITNTVIKSSSGMVFTIPIVHIGNINATLTNLKEKGYWIYGLTKDGDTTLRSATFDTPTVIVIGSEGSGIREKTLEHCDFKLSIPIDKECESLNASNAVAVTLYEWSTQQNITK